MQNTLSQTIQYVLDSCGTKPSHFRPTADMVLDCATRIFISQNISNERNNKSYDKMVTAEGIRKQAVKQVFDKEIELPKMLATNKQKFALNKMGIDFDPETLTKREAFNMIKEAKGE